MLKTNVFRSKMALLGLNQKGLADALGITQGTVSSALKRPTVSKLYELALAGIEAQQTTNLNK